MSAEAVVPMQTRPGGFTVPIAGSLVPLPSVDVSVQQERPKGAGKHKSHIFVLSKDKKSENWRLFVHSDFCNSELGLL